MKRTPQVCIRTVDGARVCGVPVARRNPTERDVSVTAANALAEIINSQPGAPQARVWVPSKAGYEPRVYVGNAGYFTMHRYDVAGHVPAARRKLTLNLVNLYPAQRRAVKAALELYRTNYAVPQLEQELRGGMLEIEQEAAVLAALDKGGLTWGEIMRTTGLNFSQLGDVMRRLRAQGRLA